jgi:hypothetical protein
MGVYLTHRSTTWIDTHSTACTYKQEQYIQRGHMVLCNGDMNLCKSLCSCIHPSILALPFTITSINLLNRYLQETYDAHLEPWVCSTRCNPFRDLDILACQEVGLIPLLCIAPWMELAIIRL